MKENENKKTFIENQTGIYPKIEEQNLISIKEIANLNKRLDETFELKNQKAVSKELLEEIEN